MRLPCNPALEIAERGRAREEAELLASRLSPKPKDELPWGNWVISFANFRRRQDCNCIAMESK